jgi:hypothetical protein
MHGAMGAHEFGPTPPGSVVVELGPGTGALVIHTGVGELLREIEIGPAGDPDAPRRHAAVRERRFPGGVGYAAFYPELPPGRYTVWADADTPAGTVDVRDGAVTEYPSPGAARRPA